MVMVASSGFPSTLDHEPLMLVTRFVCFSVPPIFTVRVFSLELKSVNNEE
jgi:hypothetical protein